MAGSDKRKQSIYIPASMLREINAEMNRLDRSRSWIVQRCIKLGLPEIRKLPSVNELPDDEDTDETSDLGDLDDES
jgi:uncharacterized small protein (TIGR04563 family)